MNHNKNILKFLTVILSVASPFLILLILYLSLDPFKVIRKYDSYYINDHKPCAFLNNDYVSTSTYDRWKDTYHYDSFIFGNSLSRMFQISDWKTHLPDSSSCYHFDASGEPLYGIWKKVMYVDKNGSNIKNAMIVIMTDTLEGDRPNDGHIYMISPQLEDNGNWWQFQKESFIAFLNPKFFFAYVYMRCLGDIPQYAIDQAVLLKEKDEYEYTTNEGKADIAEDKIKAGIYYNAQHISKFQYQSEQGICPRYIKEKQTAMLSDIKNIFDKHHSDYKIIICPTINCRKLNPADRSIMGTIFGKENVFDFTTRDSLSMDYTNYYLDGHLRPKGTRMIMDITYNN